MLLGIHKLLNRNLLGSCFRESGWCTTSFLSPQLIFSLGVDVVHLRRASINYSSVKANSNPHTPNLPISFEIIKIYCRLRNYQIFALRKSKRNVSVEAFKKIHKKWKVIAVLANISNPFLMIWVATRGGFNGPPKVPGSHQKGPYRRSKIFLKVITFWVTRGAASLPPTTT